MNPFLFVYGTLRRAPDHPMHRVLAREAEWVGEGIVAARLYDLGNYPGAVRSPGCGDEVLGEVYRLRAPERAFPLLDAYEGCGPGITPPWAFRRAVEEVTLAAGAALRAWIYWYEGAVEGRPLITGGDWLRSLRDRA